MKKSVILSALFSGLFLSAVYADEDDKVSKNLAHVEVKIGKFYDIIKKDTAKLEVEMASENAVGLENKLTTNDGIASIITFQGLTCTYDLKKFEKESNKIEASYYVKCNENMENHEMKANFSDFKNINQIKLKVEGRKETKVTVSGNQGAIILK